MVGAHVLHPSPRLHGRSTPLARRRLHRCRADEQAQHRFSCRRAGSLHRRQPRTGPVKEHLLPSGRRASRRAVHARHRVERHPRLGADSHARNLHQESFGLGASLAFAPAQFVEVGVPQAFLWVPGCSTSGVAEPPAFSPLPSSCWLCGSQRPARSPSTSPGCATCSLVPAAFSLSRSSLPATSPGAYADGSLRWSQTRSSLSP